MWGAMWYGYYVPELEHNRQLEQLMISQVEKKPVLVLTVYPSSAPYNFSIEVGPTTTIRKIENVSLIFAPRVNETFRDNFHIFLSNEGTAPTVLQYLFTDIVYGKCYESGTRTLNSTILRPGQSAEWIWTFVMGYECVRSLTQDVHGTMWFSIMTTDGIIDKTIEFIVRAPR